jgi:hypothetical protein
VIKKEGKKERQKERRMDRMCCCGAIKNIGRFVAE